ncbi:MAG: hypothetical protein ACYTGP_12485 [Planctomycetota bacterium]|jgi:hypothetical protein
MITSRSNPWFGVAVAVTSMVASTTTEAGPPCVLDPPCIGVAEGEPCDETMPDVTNGGCNSTPAVFGTIVVDGPAVCGGNFAFEGIRDTDWYAFNVPHWTGIEIELRAEADTAAFLVEMTPGGACPVIGFPDGAIAFSGDCDTTHHLGTGYVLPPGDYAVFVATATEAGVPVHDGLPCPDGPATPGYLYELCVRTGGPPLPCPWDLNDNGQVDFADLLQVITNWGPCPTG